MTHLGEVPELLHHLVPAEDGDVQGPARVVLHTVTGHHGLQHQHHRQSLQLPLTLLQPA